MCGWFYNRTCFNSLGKVTSLFFNPAQWLFRVSRARNNRLIAGPGFAIGRPPWDLPTRQVT
jgi:hypothetical protein